MLTNRRIAITTVLAGAAVVLSISDWGRIPLPYISGNAALLHVPVIVAGVLEGPLIGLFVGAISGIVTWLRGASPLFANPLVSVVPRMCIGVTSALTYAALREPDEVVALALAGVAGSLTNTVLVLGMGIVLGLFPVEGVPTLIPQAIAEVIITAIITVAVIAGWKRLDMGAGKFSV
jgi:uncharacterized membrane protein